MQGALKISGLSYEASGHPILDDLTLEVQPYEIHALVGANGTGKSNILEAIGVLGAAANGKVDDESLMRRGVRAGMPRLYKTSFEVGRVPSHITLSAKGQVGEEFRISLLNPLENPKPA